MVDHKYHKNTRDIIIKALECDSIKTYLQRTREVRREMVKIDKMKKLKMAEQYLGYLLLFYKLGQRRDFKVNNFLHEIAVCTNDI